MQYEMVINNSVLSFTRHNPVSHTKLYVQIGNFPAKFRLTIQNLVPLGNRIDFGYVTNIDMFIVSL